MTELVTLPEDDEPEGEEKFDFSSPEDVLIHVIAEPRTFNGWTKMRVDTATVISGKEGVIGAALYERSYGGFLDYTMESITDEPEEEGWYVVEGVTATYTKGDWGFTEDEMDFDYTGVRPATEEEIASA
jgi:hypothetical protein